ncbi:hypothetical protein D3C80_1813410 [compost metagenome]
MFRDVTAVEMDIPLFRVGITDHLQRAGNIEQQRVWRHKRIKGNCPRAAIVHQAAFRTVSRTSPTDAMRAKRPASTSSVRVRISSGLNTVPEAFVIGKVSVASVT